MTIIIINNSGYGCLCAATNYYNAVKWLIDEGWLTSSTDIYNWSKDEYNTVEENFGTNWAEIILNEWDINKFNSTFVDEDGGLYLEMVPLIGTKEES